MSCRKKQRFQVKKRNKPPSPFQSESTQYHWQEKTVKDATMKNLIGQFGFAADPTLSIQHNASTTLATMPTWYYFSCPSNLAFHDFTKKINQKKSTIILGLGLKFIPTPSLTNSWSWLRKSSYDRLFRSIHL